MRKAILAGAAAMALAGCQTASQPPAHPLMWQRIDGQRMTGNPKLQQQFFADQYACQSDQLAVAPAPAGPPSVTVTQTMNVGGGQPAPAVQGFDANRFVAAGEAGQRDQRIQQLLPSCMAAKGYTYGPIP